MKHSSSPTIQMTFECNQDWNAMKVTACGRYCDVCKKDVIDFTNRSKEEYQQLYEKNSQLCGRFLPEQLDLSLIRPIRFPFRKKVMIWASGLLLMLSYKDSQAQTDSIKTEQSAPDNAYADGQHGTITVKKAPFTGTDRSIPEYFYPKVQEPFLTTKKRMYYWSKRFPFIRSVYRRRQMLGNVRIL